MKTPFIFASTCPICGQTQSQRGHTRRALVRLITFRQTIDAYCLECDLVWAVTAEERVAIECAVEMSQSAPPSVLESAIGAPGPRTLEARTRTQTVRERDEVVC